MNEWMHVLIYSPIISFSGSSHLIIFFREMWALQRSHIVTINFNYSFILARGRLTVPVDLLKLSFSNSGTAAQQHMWTLRDASTFSSQPVIFFPLKLLRQMTDELKGQSGVNVRRRYITKYHCSAEVILALRFRCSSTWPGRSGTFLEWSKHTWMHLRTPRHMLNSYPRGQQHLIMCFASRHVKLRNVREKTAKASAKLSRLFVTVTGIP